MRLLGGVAVDGVDAAQLGARKQRRLLARLAIARGAPVSTDALVEDLWDDSPPAKPRDQVAVLVSRLRTALGADAVARAADGYALQRPWLDIDVLAERASEAGRRAADAQWAAAGETARAALVLVTGRLASELDDAAWLEPDRAATVAAIARARLVLAEAELAAGDPRLAADLAAEAVSASPYDEAALRVQMSACLAAGRPALGLAAYAAMRARLADDLGVDPAAATEQVYARLLGPAEPPASPKVLPHSPSGELAGRGPELARIAAAVAAAGRGAASLHVVSGEAGIGKTRLASAASDAARAAGAAVVRATCDELGRVLPLQPVLDALTDALRMRTADEAAALLDGEAAPLGGLLGVAEAPASGLVSDPAAGALLLQRAVLVLLERLAGSGALLLVVEDVHLADDATVALLAGLPRRAHHIAALVTTRVGEGPAWPSEVVTELGPLDLDAVAVVVGAERAEELHARSGGHPLLLAELVAAPAGAELPESLRASVSAACDRVGPAAATLRAASVLGPEIDLDLLASVLDRSEVALLDDLDAAVRMRLLVERDSGFAFRHALVREALAADAGTTRSVVLHRQAARTLAARPGADPLVVAHHARLAGDDALVADALAAGAEIAVARHDHATALELSEEALGLVPQHLAAARAGARALLAGGRPADAVALADAVDPGELDADLVYVRAYAFHHRRVFAQSRRLADKAAALAIDPRTRALALGLSGHTHHADGDVAGADERFDEARAIGAAETEIAPWRAVLHLHQGRPADAAALTSADAEDGHGLDMLAAPLRLMCRGLALGALGRPTDALTSFDELRVVVARLDMTRYAGRADNCTAWVLRALGATQRADELNAAAREAALAVGTQEAQAHAHLDLADGRVLVGDLAAAAELLDHADVLGTSEHVHAFQWRHRLRANYFRARIAVQERDLDRAEQLASDVVATAAPQGVRRYAALASATVLIARGLRGDVIDGADIDRVLDDLDGTSALEAWRVIAVLGNAIRSDRLRTEAERRLATLVAAAPADLRDELARYAATRLESATI